MNPTHRFEVVSGLDRSDRKEMSERAIWPLLECCSGGDLPSKKSKDPHK
jgi:hypothetical protein